jgi:hypothetical protein
VFPDVDGDNEDTIIQKEKDWYDGWNKCYIWDEDKKNIIQMEEELKRLCGL